MTLTNNHDFIKRFQDLKLQDQLGSDQCAFSGHNFPKVLIDIQATASLATFQDSSDSLPLGCDSIPTLASMYIHQYDMCALERFVSFLLCISWYTEESSLFLKYFREFVFHFNLKKLIN